MVVSEGYVRYDGLSWVQGALSGSELLEDDVLLVRPGPQRDGGAPWAAEGHRIYGYGHHSPVPKHLRRNCSYLCLKYVSVQVIIWALRPWTSSWNASAQTTGSPSTNSSLVVSNSEPWPVSELEESISLLKCHLFSNVSLTLIISRSVPKERHIPKRHRLLSIWWCKF